MAAAKVHIISLAAIPRAGPGAAGTTPATASLIASLEINGTSSTAANPVASVVFPEPGRPLTRTSSITS